MECLGRPVWSSYTREELSRIAICRPDEVIRRIILKNWDAIAKPIDGLGKFETMIAQIGAITESESVKLDKKAVVIMCADNGIVEEGISQSGQEVTMAVVHSMAKRQSSVGRMAKYIGADTIPVDIGINSGETPEGVLSRKIRLGTRNFRREPAMTERETVEAIAVGIDMAITCREAGYDILAMGEMGIGNTTTSSAVAAALLKCNAGKVTGRGAGLSDDALRHKVQVISDAIEQYDLYHADAFTVLMTVGGLDIAGLTGLCIGGAICHIPIVLDGVISMVAALLAQQIVPGTKEFLIPSHMGKEPAMEVIARELGVEPVIDGQLALGEGTGAVMMLALLDMALSVYQNRTTFEDIRVEQYQRH